MSESDDLPPALSPAVYEGYVRDAAQWLDDGLFTPAELDLPAELADHGIDADQFLADVRARASDDYEPEPEADDQITTTARIDWAALWQEFDFHTVDCDGRHAVPETAVLEAIRVSDQGIAGDASAHLSRAVETGALEAERVVAETGEPTLRGYRCPEVQPNVA